MIVAPGDGALSPPDKPKRQRLYEVTEVSPPALEPVTFGDGSELMKPETCIGCIRQLALAIIHATNPRAYEMMLMLEDTPSFESLCREIRRDLQSWATEGRKPLDGVLALDRRWERRRKAEESPQRPKTWATNTAIRIMAPIVENYISSMEGRLTAFQDPNTGLLTGPIAQRLLEKILLERRHPASILTFDMKGMGTLNSAFGQSATDQIVKALFERLDGILRKSDAILFRKYPGGSDEGIVTLEGVDDLAKLRLVCQKIHRVMRDPLVLTFTARDVDEAVDNLKALREMAREVASQGQVAPPKLVEATTILSRIIGQSSSQSGGCRYEQPLGMRISALMVQPANLRPGFLEKAFKILESLELEAKRREGMAANPRKNPVFLETPNGQRYWMSDDDESNDWIEAF